MEKKDLRLYYLEDGRLVKTGNRKLTKMFHRDKHYFESVEQASHHLDRMIHKDFFIHRNINTFLLLEYHPRDRSYTNNTTVAKMFVMEW